MFGRICFCQDFRHLFTKFTTCQPDLRNVAMNVAVHGCLDVGVSCDGLYRLDICIERSEKSKIRMPKHMRRRSIQVDGFADALYRSVVCALCNECIASADDIAD